MKTPSYSRRDFLQTTGRLALGAGLLAPRLAALAADRPRWAVACRDVYLQVADAPDSWSAMTALGADGAEVNVLPDMTCPSLFHPSRKYTLANADGIKAVEDDMRSSGRQITAFMMGNRLEERFDEEMAWTERLVKAAGQLGVPAIRLDIVPIKLSAEEFLPVAIKGCKRMCAFAEGTPVRFGVENHGKVTNDPKFLERLFDGVGSEKLGLTLDCANFYWWGHPLRDLYGLYEKFAPRVVHTHCKSIRYPEDKKNVRREIGWEYGKYNCPITEGDIDFHRVAAILRQANYRGDLCLEDEGLGKFPAAERAEVVKRELALLKAVAS